jgi:hypothetical protein
MSHLLTALLFGALGYRVCAYRNRKRRWKPRIEDRGQGLGFYPGAEDTELMAPTTLSDVQKERAGQTRLRLMGDGR